MVEQESSFWGCKNFYVIPNLKNKENYTDDIKKIEFRWFVWDYQNPEDLPDENGLLKQLTKALLDASDGRGIDTQIRL